MSFSKQIQIFGLLLMVLVFFVIQDSGGMSSDDKATILSDFQMWRDKNQSIARTVDRIWELLWKNNLTDLSNDASNIQPAIQNLETLETELSDAERLFRNDVPLATIPKKYHSKMKSITNDFGDWCYQRQKAVNILRNALATDTFSPQSMEESLGYINSGDSSLLRANAVLIDLEEQLNKELK